MFESLQQDGRPLHVEQVATAGVPSQTRVHGTYADWGAALHVVARLEAQRRRAPRGASAFAFGIRAAPTSA